MVSIRHFEAKQVQFRMEKNESIAGWSYEKSRAMNYLQQDNQIDGNRVAVFGHSRLGKTSLWAGRSDERFKLVISNNSGCQWPPSVAEQLERPSGASTPLFPIGSAITTSFTTRTKGIVSRPTQLIALIAPRAVYVASATEDRWADPKVNSSQHFKRMSLSSTGNGWNGWLSSA